MHSNIEMLTDFIINKLAELIDSNSFEEALVLVAVLRELKRIPLSDGNSTYNNTYTNSELVSKPPLGKVKRYPQKESAMQKEIKQQLEQAQLQTLQTPQPTQTPQASVEPTKYEWADGYVDPREDYWNR